jgi:PAS domain S-box-containing protein
MGNTWMASTEEISSSNEELLARDDEVQDRNAELHQSIAELTNLLCSVQVPIVLLGPDLRIRQLTPTAEKVFCLVRSDVGRPISDIELNIDVPDLEGLAAQVIHTASAIEQEVQDKRGRWYSLRIRPYRTLENKIDGAVLMLVDVDNLKRAEEAWHRSEQRLAADLAGMTRLQEVSTLLLQASDARELLLEIVDAAIAVTGADMGNIQLLDRDSDALKIVAHRGFEGPFLEFFNAVHGGQSACGTAMRTGKRVIIEDIAASPVFVGTAALEVMLAAGARAVQSTPLVSRSGRLVGMLSTHYRAPRRPTDRDLHLVDLLARQAADCIERTQAEEMLLASESRFRLLVEAAPNAMIMVARDGKIGLVNKQVETLFGYAREELLGKPIEILVPRRFRAMHPVYRDRFFAEPKARPMGAGRDLFGLRKDGSEVPIEIGLNPIQTPEGLTTLASIIDITERKRLEESLRQRVGELAEADRNKNEFLAILAHELRGPLSPIRNGLHILRQPNVDGSTIGRVKTLMEQQVRNLARLVDDLLDVARITQGTIRLQKETMDLAGVVDRAVESVRPLIERERHRLLVSLPQEPVHLEADPTRLEQVLVNLLHNAAKFTQTDGHIWLTAQRDNAEIVVFVRDTGIGIAPELLPRVFDMFAQEDRALGCSQSGLGIGLNLVRRLVELHGGSVQARSDGAGKGSEFVVRLPALPAQWPKPSEPPPEQEPAGRRRLRVLVVEDEPAVEEMLVMLLRLWGHAVQAVHDGPGALAVAPTFRPQVVLCDIGLPGMNGYQLARHLRQQLALNKLVLIAITGYGQEEDQRRAREAGFDHHLAKPVDPVPFEKLLASVVDAC